MEKDFANTQYKRLLEAEALEKKKRKELAKEKELPCFPASCGV